MLRIGVDIGGTFTDFAVWRDEADGYVQIEGGKLPSSRPDYARAVIEGISGIVARHDVRPSDPVLVVHGTTGGTNAIIERAEPPIALLTTAGSRDVLNIARLRLDKPVDLFNRRPPPLVPRGLVFEVAERLRADGSVDVRWTRPPRSRRSRPPWRKAALPSGCASCTPTATRRTKRRCSNWRSRAFLASRDRVANFTR